MAGMMPQGPGMMPQGMPPLQQGMPPAQMAAGLPPGASQAFSPGGSLDGSPVHQLQQQAQGYGPQAGGALVPPGGMAQGPIGASSMGGAPPQMVSSQQMYAQPGAQPGYSQAGGPYQAMPSTVPTASLPGTYPDAAGMVGQNYQPPLQYNPTSSPPNSLPSQGGMAVNQGYTPAPNMDYQAFNMQGKVQFLLKIDTVFYFHCET